VLARISSSAVCRIVDASDPFAKPFVGWSKRARRPS